MELIFKIIGTIMLFIMAYNLGKAASENNISWVMVNIFYMTIVILALSDKL